MKLLLIGWCVLLFACQNAGNPEGKPSNNQANTSLSEQELLSGAKRYIQVSLPGWRIAERSDYNVWWSFYDGGTMPYYAVSDLNDDQQADYGFILKKENSLSFVILLGKGETFSHWMAPNFTEQYHPASKNIQFGLSVEVPGQVDVVRPEIKSVILKTNAFNLMELENRRCMYYWSDGKIEFFETM